MNELIEKTINPPGIQKKNRRSIFKTISDVFGKVHADALKAFNAHFPYLSDEIKLEEHGAALLIPHLLHDSEKEYRQRVATASFFLMRAGERSYIREQLNEHFEDRYKIIEQFLRVQTKVTELTDEERTWALNLFDSLLNPNIYTELSEWFHYSENVHIAEQPADYTLDRRDIDLFDDKIYRDGRILRDGHTVFNAKMKVLRNGFFRRDGGIDRSGKYILPETDTVRMPVSRLSGMHDTLTAVFKTIATESKQLLRNGNIKRNGNINRNGWIQMGYDYIPPFYFLSGLSESVSIAELPGVSVKKIILEPYVNSIRRDGNALRNGTMTRSNLIDVSRMTYSTLTTENAGWLIRRDGMIKRDGTETRTGLGKESMYEAASATVRQKAANETLPSADGQLIKLGNSITEIYQNSIKRDGNTLRNGVMTRSNLIDVSRMTYSTLTTENAGWLIRRDGMLKRDGTEARTGLGKESIYEQFSAGMRKHHFRDGTYQRNGEILRDSMILIPLQ